MLARDLAKHLNPVHPWHIEIERHDVRPQFGDFSKANLAVHRCANHFNRWIVQKRLRDQLAHERGIVDDENSKFVAHAVAPTAGILARCEITAGTLRMSTTVPSPRIDAPLTSGEVTRRSSSALITSSSSPIKLSTASPNFRLPDPITMTKVRF